MIKEFAMDICEECPNFFLKSLGLKIVLCKKCKECHKNLEDLYNSFEGLEDNTDGE